MPIIEWNDSYFLGIGQIDGHHKHLFTLLNNTYDVFVSQGLKVEIGKVIEELVDYAIYHFAAEEELMTRHGYAQTAEHVKEHENFINQVKAHQKDFNDGRNSLSLELIVFLKDWLQEHILDSDRQWADFVRPRLGKSPQQGLQINLG